MEAAVVIFIFTYESVLYVLVLPPIVINTENSGEGVLAGGLSGNLGGCGGLGDGGGLGGGFGGGEGEGGEGDEDGGALGDGG